MAEDIYEKLIGWLITTFRALPGINTPEFRELVCANYTPEEALLALQMGPEGGTLDELADRINRKKDDLKPLLKSMAEKGTLYIQPDSPDPLYRPLGVELPGMLETAAWGNRNTPFEKRLLELWGKFKPIYINEAIAKLGKHNVAWCAVKALPPDAGPKENLFEQVKKADYIAVSMCSCRKIEQHTDHGDLCDCLVECCMSFRELARWAVEQGHGRHIQPDEALHILAQCEEKGQVHMGTPGTLICNCCNHACVNFCAQKYGLPHSFNKNHFFAEIDPLTCTSCEICIERCPVGAIKMEDTAVLTQSECIGCGACAAGCPADSIKMVRRSAEDIAFVNHEAAEGFNRMMTMTRMDPLIYKAVIKK